MKLHFSPINYLVASFHNLTIKLLFHFHDQIQRNLQLQIEEQGRQLKMMIDQQQKTSESLLKNQDFNISPFDPSISFQDVFETSIAESSGTGNISSKIS